MSVDMYQQNILDHYKHPHNAGVLEPADAQAHVSNPLCGDELDVYVNFGPDNTVAEVKFTGRGCAISQASISLLTDAIKGLTKEEVLAWSLEHPVKLLGVPINPARLKCATLSLEAVQKALGHH